VFHADRLREDALAVKAGLGAKLPRVKLHYSTKTNSLLAVLKTVLDSGWGLEAVTPGDRRQASLAGARGDQIILNGAAWNRPGLEDALLDQGIRHVTIDSLPMAELLAGVLRDHPGKIKNLKAALRIHDGNSHFGVPAQPEALAKALGPISATDIAEFGLHLHVNPAGSAASVQEIASDFRRRAHALINAAGKIPAEFRTQMKFVDLGGGVDSPFVYRPLPRELGDFHDPKRAAAVREKAGRERFSLAQAATAISGAVAEELKEKAQAWDVYFEPGRAVCTRALSTVIEIRGVKHGFYPEGDVIITDGNTAILGPLHRNVHPVHLASREGAGHHPSFIYGNLPHSGDWLFQPVDLPRLDAGDRLLISHTGAYFLPLEANFGLPRAGIYDFQEDIVLRAPETEIDPGIRDTV
jgi:diaminopimelate decarboxylase